MTKESGLGAGFYLAGYDFSGDVIGIRELSGGPAAIEGVTGIDKSAQERLYGQRTGAQRLTTWFNPTANMSHKRLSTLPTGDVLGMYAHSTALGRPVHCMIGKQLNYDGNRAQDGSFTYDSDIESNGFGGEWATLLTAGKRTDTAATNGTGVDFGQPIGATNGGFELGSTSGWAPVNATLSLESVLVHDGSFAGKITSTAGLAPRAGSGATVTVVTPGLAYDVTGWFYAPVALPSTASIGLNWYDAAGAYLATSALGTVTLVAATYTRVTSLGVVAPVGAVTASHFFQIDGTPGAGVVLIADTMETVRSAASQGAQFYLQVTAFTGTSVTVKIQDSADGVTYTDVTGGAFTAATGVTSERIQTARSTTIRRYMRAVTTGTFSNAVFVVGATRNDAPTAF